MKAVVVLNTKEIITVSGKNLKISTIPLTNEFKIYDDSVCVYYCSLSNVCYANIADREDKGEAKNE